jgi:hypothetical protein
MSNFYNNEDYNSGSMLIAIDAVGKLNSVNYIFNIYAEIIYPCRYIDRLHPLCR